MKLDVNFNLRLVDASGEFLQILNQLLTNQGTIVATLQDLNDALATAKADIATAKTAVQVQLIDLAAQVQSLKDQIAGGSIVTAADLDTVLTAIKDVDESAKTIGESVTPNP